ncbi:putative bifunctional diguanylate cyclase/phosphodiesterase [Pectobacterium brasiliense]|uniref:putative bifunctional diguanylate cyclase/phosphodiesterase n=1 Tax=Pectobacterium brasiliense TaxID=180957 RepID=UPI001968A715|nr:EAL domain-containing protein [Pectobacterium brasiliense]MBN3265581.1 EAL domain-containing protein [Pectobacterium brasiliense]
MRRSFPMTKPAAEHLAYLCRVAAYIGLVVCMGWLAFFTYLKDWELVISLLMLAVAILPCWRLAARAHFSHALVLAQTACLIFVIIFCFRYDIPDGSTQRTTHLYLPVIALVGYMNYQQYKSCWQVIVILLSLLAFVIYSSTANVFTLDDPSPHHFQVVSVWLNPVLSTLFLFGGIVAMHTDFSRRKQMAKSIQHALYNEQFTLLYQPMVNVEGYIIGAESLIRWNHPSSGLLPPSAFLPDAQEAGLMPIIGEWVISQAFKDLLHWQQTEATRNLSISINLTADHLMQPDFVRKLLQRVQVDNIPCKQVHFELTESVFVSDPQLVAKKMSELAAVGFRFSLDDFGTGFSSLSTLRGLPLEQIKIDRSFVTGATESEKGAVIAKNIARMGSELELEVVAEGIETEQQWTMMKEYGCRVFQGFLFSRPISATKYTELVAPKRNQSEGTNT